MSDLQLTDREIRTIGESRWFDANKKKLGISVVVWIAISVGVLAINNTSLANTIGSVIVVILFVGGSCLWGNKTIKAGKMFLAEHKDK